MDTDESCSRYLLENSHRQRNIAHFHQNTCTFWNSCEKIISILPSIAIWKFKHLINGEKNPDALYGWLIYAEKCCLSLNSWIAGQTGLCNFSFVSEHSVQMWLNRYVQERFFFRQKPSRFLQLLPILDKINTGLESDPSSNKLHSACCFGAKGEKFWWVVLTHFLQLSPLRNAKYFTQVCFLYLFMYLSTQILRLIYVHQRNKFIGSMNIFKWLPTYPE